jgi:hypothetical protein
MEMTNVEINKILTEYPDIVSEAETAWKMSILELERIEAKTYFSIKTNTAPGEKVTEKMLENMVTTNDEVYKARLYSVTKESEYNRLYEKLMCAKKMASLRSAF